MIACESEIFTIFGTNKCDLLDHTVGIVSDHTAGVTEIRDELTIVFSVPHIVTYSRGSGTGGHVTTSVNTGVNEQMRQADDKK